MGIPMNEVLPLRPVNDLVNLEYEQIVIGSSFIPSLFRLTSHLRPEDFAYPVHGRIWATILDLSRDGEEISPLTVAQRFKNDGDLEEAGGERYIPSLAMMSKDRGLAESAAELVRDLANRRRVVAMADDVARRAEDFGTSSDEMILGLVGELQKIAMGNRTGRTKREVAESIVAGLEKDLPCYSSGIPELDRVMGGGMFAGKLYGIAARKKVGKSLLLGTISQNLNARKIRHLVLPLEMSAEEYEQRNAARSGNFNSIRFLTRDDPNLGQRVAQYAVTAPNATFYDGGAGTGFDQIRAIVSRHIATNGIKGVVLDYWQLVGGKAARDSEEWHLREVAQWMADTARKEGVFFLTAAQVNQMGNTRGSEGLKLACDQYFTLHREKESDIAWLEMEESRYTMYQNVGSETVPGLWLDPHGPHFRGAEPARR